MAIRSWIICWAFTGVSLVFGQAQHTEWFMGYGAGLHFQVGGPVATGGPLSTGEGCASISDGAGQLLFFTDGVTVWDRSLNVMPNGSGLLGHSSSTQSALIVPMPGQAEQYVIFTAPAAAGFWTPSGTAHQYRVDMAAHGGLGDVVGVAGVLASSVTEKLTATRHANGTDIWVLYHGWDNAEYYAYLVTCTGVEGPIVSTIGHAPGYDAMGEPEGYMGCMKLSQQGDRLASVWTHNTLATQGEYRSDVIIDLLDFDNSTGVLSNIQSDTLGTADDLYQGYGVAFSPSGNVLYTTANGIYDGAYINHVRQYDLALPLNAPLELAAIPVSGFGTVQLGPDGALYIARSNGATYLSRITSPDVVGAGCGFVDEGVSLGTALSTWGLPNQWDTYSEPVPYDPVSIADTLICGVVDLVLDATYTHPFQVPGYLWSTGETTASITVHHAGTYTVQVLLPCATLYDTIRVERGGTDFTLGEDVRLCDDQAATFTAPEAATILWSTGDTVPTITVTEEGFYSVRITDPMGCVTADSVRLTTRNCACAFYLPNAFSPNNDGINDFLQPVMDCEPAAFELELLDRWGTSLFRTTDVRAAWGATGAPIGVYAYRLSYAWDDGRAMQQRAKTGQVTLVR